MSQNGRPVVLIADKLAQSTVDALGDGVEVRWVDGPDRPALLAAVPEADALLVRSATTVDAEVLAAATKLKIVGRAGVGLDNVDIPAATDRGVMVVNAPTSNIHSAAEHAVSLLLSTARQIPAADRTLREDLEAFELQRHRDPRQDRRRRRPGPHRQLFAQRLAAFETDIIAYDPYLPAARAAQLGIELVDIDELVERADFISVHLPKTKRPRVCSTPSVWPRQGRRHHRQRRSRWPDRRGRAVRRARERQGPRRRTRRLRNRAVHRLQAVRPRQRRRHPPPRCVHLGGPGSRRYRRREERPAGPGRRVRAGRRQRLRWPGRRRGRPLARAGPQAGPARRHAVARGRPNVQVVASGELSAENVDILGLAALRGLFSASSDEAVTFVNAPQLAEQRGVSVEVEKHSEARRTAARSRFARLPRTAPSPPSRSR